MKLPNFFVVGAAKAGTTALCEYISQHPQIYISPIKEPNFFATENGDLECSFTGHGVASNQLWIQTNQIVTSWPEYEKLFQKVSGEKAIGEGSTIYLYSKHTARRIFDYSQQAKIIIVLRNPVERAYSHYLFRIRHNQEPVNVFSDALDLENQRIEDNWGPPWHYQRRSFYYEQVKRYLDIFGLTQVRIYLFEDFKHDTHTLLEDIYRFLRVAPNFKADTQIQYNPSGIPKNAKLQTFLEGLNDAQHPLRVGFRSLIPEGIRKRTKVSRERAKVKLMKNNLAQPPLSPEVRAQLINVFREDILKLQDMIQRDLSAWLV
ncbi:MAG: sulfotransferase domain-containing protein [Cyanobacteria bacterium P01_D01_bin.156]